MSVITFGEREAALQKITLDMTVSECPCGTCMGTGCGDCAGTGADLASLRNIRKMVANALDTVKTAQGRSISRLAQGLRL
jgi:hypothetical protein